MSNRKADVYDNLIIDSSIFKPYSFESLKLNESISNRPVKIFDTDTEALNSSDSSIKILFFLIDRYLALIFDSIPKCRLKSPSILKSIFACSDIIFSRLLL